MLFMSSTSSAISVFPSDAAVYDTIPILKTSSLSRTREDQPICRLKFPFFMKTPMASMQSEKSRTKTGYSNIPWKDISKEHRAGTGKLRTLVDHTGPRLRHGTTQRMASRLALENSAPGIRNPHKFVLTVNPALCWSDISRIPQVLGVWRVV